MTDWNAMSDADFRREVRQFFEAEYPEELRHLPHRPRFAEIEHWHRKLHANGWVAPAWPTEYGGMGLSASKLLIFYEEQQRWGVNRGRDMGVQMVGPLIIKFGTEAQRAYWLPRILSCKDIWCQGYSEPGAGSDLANLRTSAVIKGDEFVINGQKIWTTMAHDATHIFMLVRTDPKAPRKQQGISFILVPMDQQGIEVRTITTLAGETEFCEVFFDDARTPFENLVGELNKGWTMAKSLLSFERVFIGAPNLAQNALGQLEVFARSYGRFDDPVFCDRFAEVALDVEDHAALYARFADQLKRGETLGADVSMLKIWVTETFQKITELMIEAAGSDGATLGPLQVGNVGVDVLASFYKARPATIYGGSNEIQRNILSKAVLGLPG
ncbi:acyl-CoA dehydrogenase family protein [uncultured Bradyrhizobium sp.]|uniref:acyl-CoA dehydrogenase family protein n=1 Tax=uncultured Bradyrhizobium sp. TaxID=199684 RepID=UPI00262B1EE9|nr:acyl-CoA dehydrogenase family protein [uncultured Bradyrhizobium sp.]